MGLIYTSNFSVHSQLSTCQEPPAKASSPKCPESSFPVPVHPLKSHMLEQTLCFISKPCVKTNHICHSYDTGPTKEQRFHLSLAPLRSPTPPKKKQPVSWPFLKGILKLTYPDSFSFPHKPVYAQFSGNCLLHSCWGSRVFFVTAGLSVSSQLSHQQAHCPALIIPSCCLRPISCHPNKAKNSFNLG